MSEKDAQFEKDAHKRIMLALLEHCDYNIPKTADLLNSSGILIFLRYGRIEDAETRLSEIFSQTISRRDEKLAAISEIKIDLADLTRRVEMRLDPRDTSIGLIPRILQLSKELERLTKELENDQSMHRQR